MSKMHYLLGTLICFLIAPSIPVGADERSHTQENSYGLTNASLKAQEEMLLNLLATDTPSPKPKADSEAPSSPDYATNTDSQMEEALLAARALVPSPEETEQQKGLLETVQSQRETIDSLTSSKLSLENRLRVAESKLTEVIKQLEQTREDLLLAETEVERLSYVIEKRNIHKIRTIQGRSTQSAAAIATGEVMPKKEASPLTSNSPSQESSREQISIATVTAQKANLRTGPGLNNSVLLTVSKNSRLVVESRQGDWYRIIAPTGERAWISGTVIHFGKNGSGHPNEILRIKGVSGLSAHQE